MLSTLAGPLVTLISKVVDRAVPDRDQAERLKAELTHAAMAMDKAELDGAISLIQAEAGGESWLQRNWRPVLMLWFAGLVGAHWLGFTAPNLPEGIVSDLLGIVQVGIGGYVIGRSGEKIVKAYRE